MVIKIVFYVLISEYMNTYLWYLIRSMVLLFKIVIAITIQNINLEKGQGHEQEQEHQASG